MRGGFFIVIYVDVLFVVNFFITYLLLLLTAKLSKNNATQLRLLLSSSIGGLYSLVILIDNMNTVISIASKLAVSCAIVLVAFRFYRLFSFVKALLVFYFSNIIVLGVVMAIQLVFNKTSVTIVNGIPYFNITAKALLFSAILAYLISLGIIKLYNYSISKSEVYNLSIFKDDKEYHLFAFSDSGNKLREPFSDLPVIVVDKSKIDEYAERVVPYNTVAGEGMMCAFRPDRITISNGKSVYETDRVYIALSTVDSKEFSAILNPEILNV